MATPDLAAPVRHATRTLGILGALNLLNYMDRYLAAPMLPLISRDLHLSDAQAGFLQTAFIFVYAIASPAAGWLGDRHARLRLAAAGVAVWSLATLGSGMALTFATLLLARAILGIGEASYSVVTPSVVADLYPPDQRGRALAWFYSALSVGSALGYIVGGQVGAAFGWRPAFFIVGGPGLMFAVALLFLAEPVRGRFDPPTNRAPLGLKEALRALRSKKSYLVNTAAQTIYTFSMGGLAAWMPTYFYRERHLPLATASTIFGGVLVVAGFLGTLAGGQIGDRMARRFPGGHFTLSGIALVASVPFSAIAILASSPAIFWPAMFVTLFLLFLNTGPLNAAMANVLPPDLRARGFALYSMAIHLLGDGLSPWLIGLASNRTGLRLPVLAAGLLLGASGLVLLAGRRHLASDLAVAA